MRFMSSIASAKVVLASVVITLVLLTAGCDSVNEAPHATVDEQNPSLQQLDERTAALLAESFSKRMASADDAKEINKALKKMSKSIAKILADRQTSTWLHNQVMKKFDGDTDVLWMHLD